MSTTNSATQWKYDWSVQTDYNGTLNITILGYDQDNNANSGNASLSYVIDNISANAEITTNQTDAYLKAGESIIVTTTFDEAILGDCIVTVSGLNTNTVIAMSATPRLYGQEIGKFQQVGQKVFLQSLLILQLIPQVMPILAMLVYHLP